MWQGDLVGHDIDAAWISYAMKWFPNKVHQKGIETESCGLSSRPKKVSGVTRISNPPASMVSDVTRIHTHALRPGKGTEIQNRKENECVKVLKYKDV